MIFSGVRTAAMLGAMIFVACGESTDVAECLGTHLDKAYPPLTETRNEWLLRCSEYKNVYEGLCSDGTTVLGQRTDTYREERFFDSNESFKSVIVSGDVRTGPCSGQSYWPVVTKCPDGVVTKVLCGFATHVGDSVHGWKEY